MKGKRETSCAINLFGMTKPTLLKSSNEYSIKRKRCEISNYKGMRKRMYVVVGRIGWNGLGGGENSDVFFLERVGLVENEPLFRDILH